MPSSTPKSTVHVAVGKNVNENSTPSADSHAKILVKQEQERKDLQKRIERIKSSIPRKDRIGRARAAEDAAEEEKRLLEAQSAERLEYGIPDSAPAVLAESEKVASTKATNIASEAPSKTESKAARRRRKKAEQEAQAQRRVDEEKANMGPSPKFLEIATIDAQLKPKNLRIHSVPADGHCLYSAVAHQMATRNIQSTLSASVEGLRAATADYLLANKDAYLPFIETIDGDEELFREYCEELRNEAVWGGQVELKAMAELLGTEIEVYAAGMPIVKMGNASDSAAVLRVSFHRQYFGLGEHYNSVVSVDE